MNGISYWLNCMGPMNQNWIKENGNDWALGRVDIHGEDDPYGRELGVPMMKSKNWIQFGDWLDKFSSEEVLTLNELVDLFEKETNNKIIWFKNP